MALCAAAACHAPGEPPRDAPARRVEPPAPAPAPPPAPEVDRFRPVVGRDLRTGAPTCGPCATGRPTVVVAGRPDDPRFGELARDADAVAAKYAGRLDARILVPETAVQTSGTGGTGPGSASADALLRVLRVEAPVVAVDPRAPIHPSQAPFAPGAAPLVALVRTDGTIAYRARAPEDLYELHRAFLALPPPSRDASVDAPSPPPEVYGTNSSAPTSGVPSSRGSPSMSSATGD